MRKKKVIIISILLFLCLYVSFNSVSVSTSNKINNREYMLPNLGDEGIYLNANVVSFNSNILASRDVKSALDEIYEAINNGCRAGYTKGEEVNKTYKCTLTTPASSASLSLIASSVQYNHSTSGLSANNLEDAINELAGLTPYCKSGYAKANVTSNSYDCSTYSFSNNPEVTITGTNTWGNTLTATISTAPIPTPDSYTYQWYVSNDSVLANAVAIQNATAATYSVPSSYIGKYLFVEVTAHKQYYSDITFSDGTDAANNTTAAVNKKASTVILEGSTKTLTYSSNDADFGVAIGETGVGDGEYNCTSSNTDVATCDALCSTNRTTGELTCTPPRVYPKALTSDNQTAVLTISRAEGATYLASDSQQITITVNRATLICPGYTTSTVTFNGSSQSHAGNTCPSGSTGTTASGTNANTYYGYCNPSAGYKFASTCTRAVLVINKANSDFACANKTYNGNPQAIATCTTGTLSNATRTAYGSQTVSCSETTNYKSGSGTCWVYKANSSTKINNTTATSGTTTYGTNVTATISSTGDGSLTCSSSNEGYAKCSIAGSTLTMTPQAANSDGSATITVTRAAGTNYNASSATYTITVNRQTLGACSTVIGTTKTYNGKEQCGNAAVCPANSTGSKACGTNGGSYSTSCTANAGYKFSSTACSASSITIEKAPCTCTWNQTFTSIKKGNSKTLTANCVATANNLLVATGNIDYTSNDTSILTYTDGTVKGKKVGSTSVKYAKKSNSNFERCTVSKTIAVTN